MRAKVVRLIQQKYSGEVGQRCGPTLGAEHLAGEDQIQLSASTVRRWMLAEGLWSKEERAGNTSGSWCRGTEVSMNGWKDAGRVGA